MLVVVCGGVLAVGELAPSRPAHVEGLVGENVSVGVEFVAGLASVVGVVVLALFEVDRVPLLVAIVYTD